MREGRDRGRRGQCRPPKLKLAPQNYFPGAGAGNQHMIHRREAGHTSDNEETRTLHKQMTINYQIGRQRQGEVGLYPGALKMGVQKLRSINLGGPSTL